MLLIVIGARPIWVLAERELGGLERGRGRLLGTRRVELWDAQPKEGHATATARAGQKPSVPRASDPSLHDREHVSKSRQVKFRNLTKTIEVSSVQFSYFTVPPRAHPSSANYTLTRGGEVSARAHTCVAWGRCVAFGRPKMSVWGHTGAGSAHAKVACNSKFAHPNLELI